METVLNAMRERRSVRKYKADMPSREIIDKVIEAGLWAASGMGRQPCVIVAVTDKALRDRLSEMNRAIGGWQPGFDPFYGAPVALIVLADKSAPTAVYDGSLVMGNLMLAAHALGLGSCWIHRCKQMFELPEGKALLKKWGLPETLTGVASIALGYAACEHPAAKPRKADYILKV